MRTFLYLAILAAPAIPSLAQDAPDVRFETGVTNIQVDALISSNGKILRGLGKGDFVIRDNGRAQPLLGFEEESTPLDLVLLLDNGSPRETINRRGMFAAAAEAVRQMRPQDRMAVIPFPDMVVEQDLTSDQNQIGSALKRVEARDVFPGPPITSSGAIQWAGWLLAAGVKTAGGAGLVRKRAIVAITLNELEYEGGYREGYPDEPMIQQLWEIDAALHLVQFKPKDPRVAPGHRVGDDLPDALAPYYRRGNVQHIAKATGGEVTSDPQKNFPDLLAGIHSSYILWYKAPEAKPGELRHVIVELSDEAKNKYPGAEIKAREGYVAR